MYRHMYSTDVEQSFLHQVEDVHDAAVRPRRRRTGGCLELVVDQRHPDQRIRRI